jgi:hypothetical protein
MRRAVLVVLAKALFFERNSRGKPQLALAQELASNNL